MVEIQKTVLAKKKMTPSLARPSIHIKIDFVAWTLLIQV